MARLRDTVAAVAERHGEAVLMTPDNPVSIAVTLGRAGDGAAPALRSEALTALGSQLFTRLVSGARVVVPTGSKRVEGVHFEGFGAHVRDYPTAYFTVASALGQRDEEIDLFARRLGVVLAQFRAAARLPEEGQPAMEAAAAPAAEASEDA